MKNITPSIQKVLDKFLDEDIGRGDLSLINTEDKFVNAHWISKQNAIFCGGLFIEYIFLKLNASTKVKLKKTDGETLTAGEKILELTGPVASLLSGERTALNLSMHLSGIATATKKMVSYLEGTEIKLADTRKTTPGLRVFEKYAFRCGGGINHRMGLDDAAMLKENHIAWGQSITQSVEELRQNIPWTAKIIVEAETPQQAKEAVQAGADGVLLDEMNPEKISILVPQLREIASIKNKKVIIEASGINPNNIKKYLSTGIDLISSSAAITKSPWIDFSMRFNSPEQDLL